MVRAALLVRVEAKRGKEAAVAEFLEALAGDAAVREAAGGREVRRGVRGGAAGVEQDEVGRAVLECRADVVGVGLDREPVGEVRVGDLGLGGHGGKRRRGLDGPPVA